jgi:chorismate mutase
MSFVHGIRGATTVKSNSAKEILEASAELLQKIQMENSLHLEDIASVIFSVTTDLDAAFPAVAARSLGWNTVPLICTREIPVPGSLPLCIRVLIHVNTEKKQSEMKPIYLRDAVKLRPDHAGEQQ